MLDSLLSILKGVAPAVGAALLLVGVFGSRCLGLALATAVFGAYALLERFPLLPDELFLGANDAVQWLCWSLLLAGLLALAGGIVRLPHWLGIAAGLLLLGGEVWLILQGTLKDRSTLPLVLTHGVAIVMIGGVWIGVRQAVPRRPDGAPVVVWAVCLLADSGLLLWSGSALLAQLALAAAVALGCAVLAGRFRTPFTIDRALALPFAAAHGGLLLLGQQLGGLGIAPALLLLLSPASLALLPAREPEGEGQATFVAVALVAATMLGAAAGLVARG
jgi:hypothetical protein